jgi:hypothetical protein
VLKSIGTTAVGAGTRPAVTVARPAEQFKGVLYDPVTGRVLGSGEATAVRGDGRFDGTLRFPDRAFAVESTVNRTIGGGRVDVFNDSVGPASVDVLSTDRGSISGIVRQPGGTKQAFYLASRRHGDDPRQTRRFVKSLPSPDVTHTQGRSPSERGEK